MIASSIIRRMVIASKRTIGNLYIGSNVKQRAQLGENYLGNINVVAVNVSKNLDLVKLILEDQGAKMKTFDWNENDFPEVREAILKADILLDGVQNGGKIEEAAAENEKLIVAHCDCDDPFSAMSAVARISMALAERQRTGHGQRLIANDNLDYWRHLNKTSKL